MHIVISSAHGKHVRGASDIIDEVDESRRVVNQVASYLTSAGVSCDVFHDNISTTQSENLNRIIRYHNSKTRDLDVSIHFNSFKHTAKARGTECLYLTQADLADKISEGIALAGGFINRGPKKRTNLAFLNRTKEPAVLLEICFVDSEADVELYKQNFYEICRAIAEEISGKSVEVAAELLEPSLVSWRTDITATEFAGEDDPQNSAYDGKPIDGNALAVALPYKWKEALRPDIIVEGPEGEIRAELKDVGPWNTNDPKYVLEGARPLSETQFEDETRAQNGMIPSNDAGIDLTPAAAQAVGISGKGKVRWRFA